MKRLIRILRRVVLALVLIGTALLALYVFVLPGFVTGKIRDALAAAGLPGSRSTLATIGPNRAELVGVRLGTEGRMTADSIVVRYDASSLDSGRVKTVVVSGCVLRVGVKDGHLDLGDLENLHTNGEGGGKLPFDRLEIHSSLLELDLSGSTFDIPIEGEIRPEGNRIAAHLTSRFLGRRIVVGGTWNRIDGSATLNVEVTGPAGETFTARAMSRGAVTDGAIDADFSGVVPAFENVIAGHLVVADDARFSGRLSFTGLTEVDTAHMKLTADRLRLDGRTASGVSLDMKPAGDDIGVRLSLTTKGIHVAVASSFAPPDLAHPSTWDRTFPFSIRASGPLPRDVLDLVRARGVRIPDGAKAKVDLEADVVLGKDGPHAHLDDAHVAFSAAAAYLPAPRLFLANPTMDLSLTGDLSESSLDVSISHGSVLRFSPALLGVLDRGQGAVSAEVGDPLEMMWSRGSFRVEIGSVAVVADGLDLRAGRTTLTDCSARFQIAGSMSDRAVSLTIADGGSATVSELSVPGAPRFRATIGLVTEAALGFSLEDPEPVLRAPEVSLSMRAAAPVHVPGSITLDGLSADFSGSLTLGPGGIRARILESSRLQAGSVVIEGYRAGFVPLATVPETQLDVAFGKPLAVTFRGGIHNTAPIGVDGPRGSARIRQVSLLGSGRISLDEPPVFVGMLRIGAEEAALPALDARATGITAEIPLGVGDDSALPDAARLVHTGFLRIEGLRWRKEELPPPALTLEREDGVMSFGLTWPITHTAKLTGRGSVTLEAGAPVGRVDFALPRCALPAGGRIVKALGAATGFDLSGEVAVTGEIRRTAERFVPRIDVSVFDVAAEDAKDEHSITGLSGTIRIESFSPISTPGAQRLSFREAKLGDVRVDDGEVRFRVESPRSILCERAKWRLGKQGTFRAYAFRVDPVDPNLDVVLYAEDLSLEDWLSVVTGGNATGEGLLYGRLDLMVRTKPRLSVTLGEGFLHAEGVGKIRVTDTTAVRNLLAGNLPEVLAGTGSKGMLEDRIVSTLADFEFTSLRFDVKKDPQGLTLAVNLDGHGVEPPHQVIGIHLTVHGFEDLIGPALALKLALDRIEADATGASR